MKDQKLISHDNVDALTSGANYGAVVPLTSVPDGVGIHDAVINIMEAYPAGTVTIALCSSDTVAEPTTVTQTFFTGSGLLLTAGRELKIGIETGVLKKYNRFNVTCSATLATGKVLTCIEPRF